MLYGILSDIHGNLEALDAVLGRLREEGVSEYLCLGDLVGYGADPNACCEQIRALPCLTVVGNHDQAALDTLDLRWFNANARAAAGWTRRQLTPQTRHFLAGIPEQAFGPGFQMVHGSLAKPTTGYITDAFEAIASLEIQREPLCFVGHTHVPAAYACRSGSLLCSQVAFRPGQPVHLRPDCRFVVNCGGVGQPRDGNPAAACGIYDRDAGVVKCLRVAYDVAAAADKIRRAGLPAPLAERLFHGR